MRNTNDNTMAVNFKAIVQIKQTLGAKEAAEILRLSKKADKLEAIWRAKFKTEISKITKQVVERAEQTGRLTLSKVDFREIVLRHSLAIMEEGYKSTKQATPIRMATRQGPPKDLIPKKLKDLRIMWDRWRKKKELPPRQKIIAERLKQAYVKKLQSVWKRAAADTLEGKSMDKNKAIAAIINGADVVVSRAKMIVETETTHYYNAARRTIYDESPDVEFYLFVAIRDHATTKWCKTRHHLVYKKGDPILNTETPPIHWNCRSELLPMTPLNPNHLKIIRDKKKQRRNNRCEPLPKDWTGRDLK